MKWQSQLEAPGRVGWSELPGEEMHVPVQAGHSVAVAGHGPHALSVGHVPQLHATLAIPDGQDVPLLKHKTE
jgi:hypothetical protein